MTSLEKMTSFQTVFWLMTCSLGIATKPGGADTRDYCPWETFNVSCDSNEVIVIDSAHYGRMKHSRCFHYDFGYVGCFKDVLDLADSICSGQRRCEIKVPSAELDKTEPCVHDIKSYLEIGYSCKKVIVPEVRSCRSLKFARLSEGHGFLSNLVTAETGCGSVTSPWLIEAKSGQHINVTLWNFATGKTSELARALGTNSCLKYATLAEADQKHNKVVCGDFARITHVYTSIGSTLDVRIHSFPMSSSPGTYFLLEYQTIGCSDPVVPEGSTFKRQEAKAVIWCESSSDTWTLECRGSDWVGEFRTCSRKITSGENGFRFPSVMSVVMIISISLLIGLLILLLGMLYLCRRQRSGTHRHNLESSALDGIDQTVYDHSSVPKSLVDPLAADITSSMLHPYERESNDYASIWEWPIPQQCPAPSEVTGEVVEGYPPEPYQGRLTSTSREKPEHPYQLPGASTTQTTSSGITSQHLGRAKDDCFSALESRYFELDPSGRTRSGRQRDAEPEVTHDHAEKLTPEGRGN